MEPYNLPMVVLGAGLLWFGWFGFNAGSALAADGKAVNAFVVTNTAAAAGVLGWTVVSWLFDTKPSVIGAASGAVAGLVAITPAAGLLVRMNLDNALSVWGVHGIGGTWGALATGLFVGVGFGSFVELAGNISRMEQILNQLVAVGATSAWAFILTALILWALKLTIGLRVPDNDAAVGLDVVEHGETAYRW